MTKLLITEITRMGPAFCVIGLQHEEQKFQSIRPVPTAVNGWLHFPYHRGEVLECSIAAICGSPPHVEDRALTREFRRSTTLGESDTVAYLRKAECADSLRSLFECAVYENKRGSGAYSLPAEARRSICGCSRRASYCATFLSWTAIGLISWMPHWPRAGEQIAWRGSNVS